MSAAPILARNAPHGGGLVVLAPAALIDQAIADGTPLTMNTGPLAGDTVYIGTGYQPEPGTQVGWHYASVAYELTHRVHGVVKAAYISETPEHLEAAPKLRAARRGPSRTAPPAPDTSTPAGRARAAGARHGVTGEVWDDR